MQAQDQEKRKPLSPSADRIAWFAMLEHGRETNDAALAAKARRQLDRLGVVVRFHRSQPEAAS